MGGFRRLIVLLKRIKTPYSEYRQEEDVEIGSVSEGENGDETEVATPATAPEQRHRVIAE